MTDVSDTFFELFTAGAATIHSVADTEASVTDGVVRVVRIDLAANRHDGVLKNFFTRCKSIVKFDDTTWRRCVCNCRDMGRIHRSIYREDTVIIIVVIISSIILSVIALKLRFHFFFRFFFLLRIYSKKLKKKH